MDLNRDFAKLTEKLKNSKKIEIPLTTTKTEQEAFVHGLISKALSYINQVHINSTMHMIVSGLLENGEKAVLKKLYFKKEGSDPASVSTEKLKEFYSIYCEKNAAIQDLTKKLKAIIVFKALLSDDGLEIKIENSGLPDEREAEFIKERMKQGYEFSDLKSLSESDLSTGEGDGRSLILSIMTLKHSGISPDVLTFYQEGKITGFRIFISKNTQTQEKLAKIEESLLNEIETLPSIPDHISKIIRLCESDKSDIRQVVNEIERDPSIAGQIIKLANSGGFAGGQVSELKEAVQIIGLSNISGLLLKVGTFKVLEDKYNISEELIEHPVQVAFYSRMLARQFKLASAAEQAYIGGLLHDIGKIVLHAKMQNRESFKNLTVKKDKRSFINLEELQCGVNHAVLGGLLARKWKFHEDLCLLIENHHSPLEISSELKQMVYLIYLANAISNYQNNNMHFFDIEPEVLAFFNITSPDAFEMIGSGLSTAYQNINKQAD